MRTTVAPKGSSGDTELHGGTDTPRTPGSGVGTIRVS